MYSKIIATFALIGAIISGLSMIETEAAWAAFLWGMALGINADIVVRHTIKAAQVKRK